MGGINAAITAKRDHAKKFMTDRGLSPSLLPKAVFVHEILGLAMLAITWTLSFHFPPSNLPGLSGPINRINQSIPKNYSWLSNKVGRSYIEASCCRKLIRPLTIPAKLYMTFAIMSSLEGFESKVSSDSNYSAFINRAARRSHFDRGLRPPAAFPGLF
jgi:hypothetical protein